jgi:hypothetical protein
MRGTNALWSAKNAWYSASGDSLALGLAGKHTGHGFVQCRANRGKLGAPGLQGGVSQLHHLRRLHGLYGEGAYAGEWWHTATQPTAFGMERAVAFSAVFAEVVAAYQPTLHPPGVVHGGASMVQTFLGR